MSRRTLITVLFITILLVALISFINNRLVNYTWSYKYSLVNTTKDEAKKETIDKLDNVEESVLNSNYEKIAVDENSNSQIDIEQRTYESVSRSVESDRKNLIENNLDLDKKVKELSTECVVYVDTLSEKVVKKEEFVQGIKVVTYNNITYDLYSNGYKEITNLIESIEIDNSNYNGSTQALQVQAKKNLEIYNEKIEQVVSLTNQYRNELGLNNLVLDKNLCLAASVRALEMSYTENLSHIRPDGAKCFMVLEDLNINYCSAGENIADGFKDSKKVCEAWKNSQSHYKNIACKKYNKLGIGIAKSLNGKYYWVQIFSN